MITPSEVHLVYIPNPECSELVGIYNDLELAEEARIWLEKRDPWSWEDQQTGEHSVHKLLSWGPPFVETLQINGALGVLVRLLARDTA